MKKVHLMVEKLIKYCINNDIDVILKSKFIDVEGKIYTRDYDSYIVNKIKT